MNLIEVTLNGIKKFIREDLYALWNKTGWERIQDQKKQEEPKVSPALPVKKTRSKKVKADV